MVAATLGLSTVAASASPGDAARSRWRPDDAQPLVAPAYHVLNGVSAIASDDVLAVGVGGPVGGEGRAWQWDGDRWTSTRPGCDDDCGLAAVTRIAADDAWAVGDDEYGRLPVALHWDGDSWQRADLPTSEPDSADRLRAVSASGPNDVWAAGYTAISEEDYTTPLVEHFDGRRWRKVDSIAPHGVGSLDSIVAAGPDDVWAVGYADQADIVEHWDGQRWKQSRAGLGPNDGLTRLYSLAALGPNDVWAAGLQVVGSPRGPKFFTLVVHWDGSRWHRIRPPNSKRPSNWIYGLAVAADDDIWIVGGSGGINDYVPARTLTEHYDGHTWQIVDSPNPGGDTNSLSSVSIAPNGEAWAVGRISSDDQQTYQTLALHWDGHRWRNQPIRPRR